MNTQQLARPTDVLNVVGSRNQRRIDFIRESMMQEDNEESNMAIQQPLPLPQMIKCQVAINWDNFWKRARIYPEQEVAYADASQHVSTRRRIQNFRRQRANAYVSDTDESESGDDIVV